MTYIDCKLLKSPMAGEISPPKFKLDRFLQRKKAANLKKQKCDIIKIQNFRN